MWKYRRTLDGGLDAYLQILEFDIRLIPYRQYTSQRLCSSSFFLFPTQFSLTQHWMMAERNSETQDESGKERVRQIM